MGELSVDTWVADLEAVVDAAGLERFDLLGVSQGAAIGVAFAARHPQRVASLVLYGGYARGRRVRGQEDQEDALVHGLEDSIVLPSMARHVVECCPTAVASWYDGVGHMPFVEAQERFDEELVAFVDRARASRSSSAVT